MSRTYRTTASRLTCADLHFVEAEFPRPIAPRLVLTFNQGISILLENPADIDLACELVVALRSRLARKGGRPC
jgi:hypothetical protein